MFPGLEYGIRMLLDLEREGLTASQASTDGSATSCTNKQFAERAKAYRAYLRENGRVH